METADTIYKILGEYDANKVAGLGTSGKPDLKFHSQILRKAEDVRAITEYPEWKTLKTLMVKIQTEALHKFRFDADHPLEENGVVIAFERLHNMIEDLLVKGEMSRDVLKGNK